MSATDGIGRRNSRTALAALLTVGDRPRRSPAGTATSTESDRPIKHALTVTHSDDRNSPSPKSSTVSRRIDEAGGR